MVASGTARAFALTALIALPAFGQFQNLVTTEDGSIVLFSSPLRLKNTDQPLWPKLFTADGSGTVHLFEQAPQWLTAADLSADGSTIAVTRSDDCSPACADPFVTRTAEIRPAAGTPVETGGAVRLSENGAHAVAVDAQSAAVIDVATGSRVVADAAVQGSLPSEGARIVANDGRVVAITAGDAPKLAVISPDAKVYTFGTAVTPAAAVIDADLNLIAYETAPAQGPHAIRLMYGPGGADAELVAAAEGCRQPVLTSDGSVLLFLSAANWEGRNSSGQPQAWMIRTDASDLRQLTNDASGVAEAAISGDGRVVWAVTYGGMLLRIDTASRTVGEIAGRTPLVERFGAARGSLVIVRGRGLSGDVTIGGRAMPVIYSSATEVRFQLPWDAQTGDLAMSAGETPFDASQPYMQTVTPVDISPEFLAAAHGDFHGPVMNTDPAAPGEIVHLYMTGLGAVSPAVAAGTPAPANPPAVITTAFDWTTVDGSGASMPADVLFAGFAPGMIGVYQVTVRLPARIEPPLCVHVAGIADCLPMRP